MWRRGFFLVILSLTVFVRLPAAAEEEETTRLTLQVLREKDKQPVAAAHVVVRFKVEKFLKDKRTSWEVQTNRKGIVVLTDVPLGPIKVQVIAKGYQTYGNEFELSKPEEQVTVLLQSPQGQVSAY